MSTHLLRVAIAVLFTCGASFGAGCSSRSTAATPPTTTSPPAESSATGEGSATSEGTGDSTAAACPKTCVSDGDCACGRDVSTHQCAFGNKRCIDTTQQCPDFCTGIGGNLQLKCVQGQCTLQ